MIKQLPLVMFHQDKHWFALEAAYVVGQGKAGLLDAETRVLDFSQLLNLAAQASLSSLSHHWLRLAGSQGRWLLGISAAAELIEMPVEQIHALPPLLQASREFKALQAVAWYQQQLVSLLDARVLLNLASPLLTLVAPDANQVESLPSPAN
ncbi:MAG TPA: hypothetical protein VJY63_07160 [Marinospirillum sp.]|uniref:hypothetical protein n=1 Tax=Marinospirillum sp. TaxID=2183934 RepID=UPI002B483660|nr:hypothetical protein [Marinospirillum sp.]HKM15682.1 hypothetical protein [Marinospirillum sp.]